MTGSQFSQFKMAPQKTMFGLLQPHIIIHYEQESISQRCQKNISSANRALPPPSSKNSKSPSLLADLRKFVLVSLCEGIHCSEKPFLTVPDLKMEKSVCLLLLILSFGYLFHPSNAVFMEKLADRKICADKYCSCKCNVLCNKVQMCRIWRLVFVKPSVRDEIQSGYVYSCLDVVSAAQALEDYIASDCRFINLKKGQMIYVYSKLKPVDGAGVFWSGSVSISEP